ncbi:MAG: hypothetical protein ACKVOI_13115 [Dongiaceae bacterium]
MNIVGKVVTLAAAAVLCAGAHATLTDPAQAGDAKTRDFVLTITGTDGVTFTGACKLRTAEGTIEMPLDGVVPEHREVRGLGLKCVIEKAGREGTITVEVLRDGKIVSYNSSSGSAGIFNVSVR